jgi:non-ribosomal peptide synthetase component F
MMHSTSLVRTLEQIGVTKGDIVPICFEKSVWTQVAILAVLLNGATFVLLDPKLPSDRLAAIVEDVDARLSLCQRSTEQVLSACSPRLKLLRLDESLSMGQNSEEVQTRILDLYKPTLVAPKDSAYIVFTSGSTGKPKGIVVSHSALSSSAMAYGKAIQIDS